MFSVILTVVLMVANHKYKGKLLIGTLWLMTCIVRVAKCSFGVQNYGFLSVYNASEPMVMFETESGLYLLNDNLTCYNHDSSYYQFERPFEYIGHSVFDNYVAVLIHSTVASPQNICYLNLYKSRWSDVVVPYYPRQCFNVAENDHLTVDPNRHLLYGVIKNMLFLSSFYDPKCIFYMDDQFGKEIKSIHVTSFKDRIDYIMVETEKQLNIYSTDGQLKHYYEYSADEKQISIDSDNNATVYIAMKQKNQYNVLKFTRSLLYETVASFTEPIYGISVSVRYILVAFAGNSTIKLRIFPPKHPEDEIIYQCQFKKLPSKVLLIDPIDASTSRSICNDNSTVCNYLEEIGCDSKELLPKKSQSSMDHNAIMKELKLKTLLSVIMTLCSIMLLCLYQLLIKNKK